MKVKEGLFGENEAQMTEMKCGVAGNGPLNNVYQPKTKIKSSRFPVFFQNFHIFQQFKIPVRFLPTPLPKTKELLSITKGIDSTRHRE